MLALFAGSARGLNCKGWMQKLGAAMNRIPTLDGWRGVAILLVLVNHAASHTRFQGRLWSSLGSLGVDIFFVLSGYIITRLLILEREKSGTIELRSFYIRRAFRILPPALTFLAVLCIIAHFIDLGAFDRGEVLASVFFFRNYWGAAYPLTGPYTSHLWSLSVEEHFYLIWPAILLCVDNRRALWIAAGAAWSCALWRLYWYTHANYRTLNFTLTRTDLRADGLLVGCALALLLAKPKVRDLVYRNFPKETATLCCFPILLVEQHNNGNPSMTVFLLIAIAIASTLTVEEGLGYKWLNSRLLVWIGTISYSLYIWQQLFLIRASSLFNPFGRLALFPLNIVAAFTLAVLSRYLLERPLIGFGRRRKLALSNRPAQPVAAFAHQDLLPSTIAERL